MQFFSTFGFYHRSGTSLTDWKMAIWVFFLKIFKFHLFYFGRWVEFFFLRRIGRKGILEKMVNELKRHHGKWNSVRYTRKMMFQSFLKILNDKVFINFFWKYKKIQSFFSRFTLSIDVDAWIKSNFFYLKKSFKKFFINNYGYLGLYLLIYLSTVLYKYTVWSF